MRRDMDGTTRFVEENRHPFEAMRILRDHDDSVQSLIPYFQASGAFAWNMEGVCVLDFDRSHPCSRTKVLHDQIVGRCLIAK